MLQKNMTIIIVLFLIGIIMYLWSFINIKNKFTNYMGGNKKNNIIERLEKSKFIEKFINLEDKSSKKTEKKLKFINSKLTLKRVFIVRGIVFLSVIVILATVQVSLKSILKNEEIHTANLSIKTDYKISEREIDLILKEIPYKKIEEGKSSTIVNDIALVALDNEIKIDEADILVLIQAMEEACISTSLSMRDIWVILMGGIVATLLVDLFIKIMVQIRKLDMYKEFEKLELISILLLGREDLNVLDILKQLASQSFYLKPYLTKCIRQYNSNPSKAMKVLIEEVNSPEFKNFIMILESCLDRGKKSNLAILKIQRNLRMVLEETNVKARNRTKNLYLTIAQIPLLFVVAFDLIIPVISNVNI